MANKKDSNRASSNKASKATKPSSSSSSRGQNKRALPPSGVGQTSNQVLFLELDDSQEPRRTTRRETSPASDKEGDGSNVKGKQPSRDDNSSDEGDMSDSESEESMALGARDLAPDLKRSEKSFEAIPRKLQPLAKEAGSIITNYTLFKKPLLSPGELCLLNESAWDEVQSHIVSDMRNYHRKPKIVTKFLNSMHQRTRGHLVAECRSSISEVYEFKGLSKEAIETRVLYLLDSDRYICRAGTREDCLHRFRAQEIVQVIFQKYFKGSKSKGVQEPDFLEKVNGVFIVFVATCIRHCLRAWKTGELIKGPDFKYQTAWCTYKRLLNTWEGADPEVQKLLVDNIKLDLARRIAANVRVVEDEPTEPPPPEDPTEFIQLLRSELKHSYDRLNVPESKRRRLNGRLRDSSVEMENNLDPPVDKNDRSIQKAADNSDKVSIINSADESETVDENGGMSSHHNRQSETSDEL